jgi:hypothetical protein
MLKLIKQNIVFLTKRFLPNMPKQLHFSRTSKHHKHEPDKFLALKVIISFHVRKRTLDDISCFFKATIVKH